MSQVNPEIPLLVSAAYDAVIRSHLEAGSRIAELFPLSDETRAKWEQQERDEMQRRESLMRDHLNEPGTTDVCRCGHVGYSTPGYLLHVYAVVEADHIARTGCDDPW
jgi:hypothetical protein